MNMNSLDRYPVISPIKTGMKIKLLMDEHNVKVTDLQELFGFSYPQAIYKWINGLSVPSIDHLIVLGRCFNVSIEELIELE